MTRKIRLAALDLDGTLLNTEKAITPRTMTALRRAHRQGVMLVPVTGRPVGGLPQAVLDLPGLRYTVTSNGATIRDRVEDRFLLERHLTPAACLAVLAASAHVPMIREVFREGVGYLTRADRDRLLDRYRGTPMADYVLASRRALPGTLEAFLRSDPRPVEELFFLTDSPETKEDLRRTLSAVPDISFADPFPNDLEVLAGGIDKGKGFLWLLDHLGVDPAETLAIGDGGSDVPLLQAAGLGVAMGNARPFVRAAADWVTDTCDRDGVAVALERFIL